MTLKIPFYFFTSSKVSNLTSGEFNIIIELSFWFSKSLGVYYCVSSLWIKLFYHPSSFLLFSAMFKLLSRMLILWCSSASLFFNIFMFRGAGLVRLFCICIFLYLINNIQRKKLKFIHQSQFTFPSQCLISLITLFLSIGTLLSIMSTFCYKMLVEWFPTSYTF